MIYFHECTTTPPFSFLSLCLYAVVSWGGHPDGPSPAAIPYPGSHIGSRGRHSKCSRSAKRFLGHPLLSYTVFSAIIHQSRSPNHSCKFGVAGAPQFLATLRFAIISPIVTQIFPFSLRSVGFHTFRRHQFGAGVISIPVISLIFGLWSPSIVECRGSPIVCDSTFLLDHNPSYK